MRVGGLSCWNVGMLGCWDIGVFVFWGYVAINANAFWCFQFFQKMNKKLKFLSSFFGRMEDLSKLTNL